MRSGVPRSLSSSSTRRPACSEARFCCLQLLHSPGMRQTKGHKKLTGSPSPACTQASSLQLRPRPQSSPRPVHQHPHGLHSVWRHVAHMHQKHEAGHAKALAQTPLDPARGRRRCVASLDNSYAPRSSTGHEAVHHGPSSAAARGPAGRTALLSLSAIRRPALVSLAASQGPDL